NDSYVNDSILTMPYKEAKDLVLRSFERKFFEALLAKAKGNISKAARLAQMHRKNLYMKLKELELVRPGETGDKDPGPDAATDSEPELDTEPHQD
ncbi:MAG TPA: helix-turn-helix domain-containing protein, partial [Candidatus Ozemobacteraceae bacterium]|nr:helix-turn-helix domain-containing protein [Candidatus Ozemobacteraceae bacterium]